MTLLYLSVHLLTLIREASFCSQWQLTQRPTTGQDEKIEKLWNAHVCVCMHVCGGRGEIRGCLCELVFSLVSAAVLYVQVIGSCALPNSSCKLNHTLSFPLY